MKLKLLTLILIPSLLLGIFALKPKANAISGNDTGVILLDQVDYYNWIEPSIPYIDDVTDEYEYNNLETTIYFGWGEGHSKYETMYYIFPKSYASIIVNDVGLDNSHTESFEGLFNILRIGIIEHDISITLMLNDISVELFSETWYGVEPLVDLFEIKTYNPLVTDESYDNFTGNLLENSEVSITYDLVTLANPNIKMLEVSVDLGMAFNEINPFNTFIITNPFKSYYYPFDFTSSGLSNWVMFDDSSYKKFTYDNEKEVVFYQFDEYVPPQFQFYIYVYTNAGRDNIEFWQETFPTNIKMFISNGLSYINFFIEGYDKGKTDGKSEGITEGYNEAKEIIPDDIFKNGIVTWGYNPRLSYDYLGGFSEGKIEGIQQGGQGFQENLHKWIVPAIIVVLLGGGFISIIVARRRGE